MALNKGYFILSAIFLVAIAVFLYLVHKSYGEAVFYLVLFTMALWFAVIVLSAREWFVDHDLLAKEVNMALVPMIINTLDRTVIYSYNDMSDKVNALLGGSNLINLKDCW